MEYWRQCAMWLISCNVLPANHRVTADTAQVFDLAQTLRDGVLLCQLLNNLKPQTINLKEINLRPQMSQFLCLKNIRTFLTSCYEVFGMRKTYLFEAFDLFDVRDFGKVMDTLSKLSYTAAVQQGGFKPFPTEESLRDEDIYNNLEDLIDENEIENDDDLYAAVYGLEEDNAGGEIYEDLMRTEQHAPLYFLNPLRTFFSAAEIDKVFVNITDLVKVHKSLMVDVQDSILNKNALNLYQIFISYKERHHLQRERGCSIEAGGVLKEGQQWKFTLRDLLVVPMQRVLKYHLLLQDLAQFVNEVKRDNETIREIDKYQRSIENLMASSHSVVLRVLRDYQQGHTGLNLFFKTEKLKKKWLDQFEMAISNIRPEKANHNSHQFKMHTFERITSCSFCHLLLRGIFNQGYLCVKCGLGAHKECLGRLGICGRTDSTKLKPKELPTPPNSGGAMAGGEMCLRGLDVLPRMVVIRDYSGIPYPQCGPPLSIHAGDVIELMFADLHKHLVAGENPGNNDAVRPCPCVPKPVDYSAQPWFAGPMERYQAEVELLDRGNSTYLIRHRSKECTEYAISIKFNDKVKHIKILTKDGCFYIAESRLFRTVADLVEYYKQHSLKEGFSSLDTTLQVPYREMSNGNTPKAIIKAGSVPLGGCSFVPPSSSPFWSVFSPRVVGIAVARYDFSSRDTRELSLQQGDIIKIYTKMTNGWWKGEVDGRMGWFPSTYVEEED
ncbi:hypothetical protein KUCAC02_017901 [Chaenocephalus aceratus]|uniref:Uncharacterized protein n=1 Tax=Chaenocephalus aceratus TaxID=36190 RepID=A0ACB9W837_CHAAC|nr:hypothetical protein KUCAC02_017901 [Chaenocephalus aceratus]